MATSLGALIALWSTPGIAQQPTVDSAEQFLIAASTKGNTQFGGGHPIVQMTYSNCELSFTTSTSNYRKFIDWAKVSQVQRGDDTGSLTSFGGTTVGDAIANASHWVIVSGALTSDEPGTAVESQWAILYESPVLAARVVKAMQYLQASCDNTRGHGF